MANYDGPDHNVIKEKHITGALSCATGVPTAYVGSTFRSAQKCVVLGCAIKVGSGGSLGATNSFSISRIGAGGVSSWKTFTFMISTGASGASQGSKSNLFFTLDSAMTLGSIGEGAVLIGQAASIDKVPVLSDIVWIYRTMPGSIDWNNTQFG